MNNVTLTGRLTEDPALRYTPSGDAVSQITLAVQRRFKRDEADFITVVLWKKDAENVANFLKKGSKCGVVGRINTRNYEGQDGKRVFVTEVIAEQVEFLDSKPQNGGNSAPNNQSNSNTTRDQKNAGFGQIDISDDDLPF